MGFCLRVVGGPRTLEGIRILLGVGAIRAFIEVEAVSKALGPILWGPYDGHSIFQHPPTTLGVYVGVYPCYNIPGQIFLYHTILYATLLYSNLLD